MKRFLLIIIVCLPYFSSFSQGSIVLNDKPFIIAPAKDSALWRWLSNYPAYTQLAPEERESIYWVNYVRQKPDQFSENILLPFLKQFPEAKSSYSRSLINDLSNRAPVPPLIPSKKLNTVAGSHARDLGAHGGDLSHQSSKGESFMERLSKFGHFECASENVYQGKEDGLQAILFLLIDTGVQNLGHRKNILDPGMKYIGVSFFPVKGSNSRSFMVQDFSCN